MGGYTMAQKEAVKKYLLLAGVLVGIIALVAVAAFIVNMAINSVSGSTNDPAPTVSPYIPVNGDNGEENGNSSSETSTATPAPTAPPSSSIWDNILGVSDRTTVLLLGIDEQNQSDVNLIMTVDASSRMIDVISVPRDTRITLPASDLNELRDLGRIVPQSGVMRLGNLYGIAGSQHAPRFVVRHLSTVFGIEIDNYVVIELSAFRNIIDAIFPTGVEFNVPRRMYYNPEDEDFVIDLQPGRQRLNGRQAEALVRYRYSLPNADLGRIAIQQDFMRAMFTQAINDNAIRANFTGAITTAHASVTATDITVGDALGMVPIVEALTNGSIRFHMLPGTEAAGGFYNYNIAEGRTFFDNIFDR